MYNFLSSEGKIFQKWVKKVNVENIEIRYWKLISPKTKIYFVFDLYLKFFGEWNLKSLLDLHWSLNVKYGIFGTRYIFFYFYKPKLLHASVSIFVQQKRIHQQKKKCNKIAIFSEPSIPCSILTFFDLNDIFHFVVFQLKL